MASLKPQSGLIPKRSKKAKSRKKKEPPAFANLKFSLLSFTKSMGAEACNLCAPIIQVWSYKKLSLTIKMRQLFFRIPSVSILVSVFFEITSIRQSLGTNLWPVRKWLRDVLPKKPVSRRFLFGVIIMTVVKHWTANLSPILACWLQYLKPIYSWCSHTVSWDFKYSNNLNHGFINFTQV